MNDRLSNLWEDEGLPAWAKEDSGGTAFTSNEVERESPFDYKLWPPTERFRDENEYDIEWGEPEPTNVSEDSINSSQQPKFMECFFKDVDGVKGDIDDIRNATKRIGLINEEALSTISTVREEELSNQLRPLIDQTNMKARKTKNILALLKAENVKLEGERGVTAGDLRIRSNLCNTLTRKFIDEMKLYQSAQQKYRSDMKKKIRRQVRLVQPKASDEYIDCVMKSEGGREAVFKGAILDLHRANGTIKTAYGRVAGKYQDILMLEGSVAELHQMFLDLALLTEHQGELLDQIEFNVTNAKNYIVEGNEKIVESIEIADKIRNKQCITIKIVMVLAIFVAFWILAALN